jgi:hypothetical protein
MRCEIDGAAENVQHTPVDVHAPNRTQFKIQFFGVFAAQIVYGMNA